MFDAKDTYVAYKGTIWAEDTALETICLSLEELFDITKNGTAIDEAYQHVSWIPFPGFPEATPNLEAPEINFVRAAKTLAANQIRRPLIIPSNSPPVTPREDTGLDGR